MQKRGQAWGLDVIIAVMIFITGIVVFYLYVINFKTSEGGEIEKAKFEARLLTESFLSEGDPAHWDATTVTKLGVLSSEQINETKLTQFYAMTLGEYERTKRIAGLEYEYYITFSEPLTINATLVDGLGRAPPEEAETTFKTTRFTSYKNQPITLEISVWKS